MALTFIKRGAEMHLAQDSFDVQPTLDDAIYETVQDPKTMEIFLIRTMDKFRFDFKLYGVDETLIRHVVDTYNKQESKRNIGVLMNGVKGTGKTVTAKIMANKLGLPVIIVDKPLPGIETFLASIPHDCVFFFDEFEKNFRNEDNDNYTGESLLSIMDGVRNSDHSHIFIMTTNELRINSNFLSRPSRVRYMKSFEPNISTEVAEEYIDDNLCNTQHKNEIIEYLDSLEFVTIDILKCIVDEVNMHDCPVSEFRRFFNVKEASYTYHTRQQCFIIGSDKSYNENDKFTKENLLARIDHYYTDEEFKERGWTWRPNWRHVETNKSWKKLKPGDSFDGAEVVKVDLENYVILTRSHSVKTKHWLVYIDNPDEKPSALGNKKTDRSIYDNEEIW